MRLTVKQIVYASIPASLGGAFAAFAGLRRFRRAWPLLAPVGVASAAVGGYLMWYISRPKPAPTRRMLFQGIEYLRTIGPGPSVAHIVRIDVHTTGIGFLTTPRTPIEGYDFPGRTTAHFLSAFGVQLAINGDFFAPWRDYGFWNYYPRTGQGVNTMGIAASRGDVIAPGYASAYSTLYLSADNRASFEPPAVLYNAISGNLLLLRDGEPHPVAFQDELHKERHPRTVAAVDQSGDTLILALVDGRQPNYSAGTTTLEMAHLVRDYGGYHALNLDGGGSTALVIQDENGRAVTLNSPIHNRIPGRQRPVANHLGVFAAR